MLAAGIYVFVYHGFSILETYLKTLRLEALASNRRTNRDR